MAEQNNIIQKTHETLESIPETQIPTNNNNNELLLITKTSAELSKISDLKNPITITPPITTVRFNGNVIMDVERLEETDSVYDSNEPDDLASISVSVLVIIINNV